MKNHIFIAILIILFSKSNFSQNSKDSIILKKNEIGIDLIPVIKIFSDIGQKYNYRGTIQYKRQINKHLYYRLGFTVIKKKQIKKYSDVLISYVDSVYDAIQYNNYNYKPEIQINSGIEYRWGKKRLNYFTGLDLGYAHTKTIYTEYYGIRSKYSNYNPNVTNPDISASLNQSNEDSIILSYTTTKNAICFTPFYGIQYHFSKHFFFSMQLSLQLQYHYNYKRMKVSEPYGILNNFSLVYSF